MTPLLGGQQFNRILQRSWLPCPLQSQYYLNTGQKKIDQSFETIFGNMYNSTVNQVQLLNTAK